MASLTRPALRIVQIDDEREFPRLVETFLHRVGFTRPIVKFDDPILGLEYILSSGSEVLPHVVLLDVQMPRLDGFDVVKQIRRRFEEREVAVFLVTATYDVHEEVQAKSFGATYYLDKMRPLRQLVTCLDETIERRRNTLDTLRDAPAKGRLQHH